MIFGLVEKTTPLIERKEKNSMYVLLFLSFCAVLEEV